MAFALANFLRGDKTDQFFRNDVIGSVFDLYRRLDHQLAMASSCSKMSDRLIDYNFFFVVGHIFDKLGD